MALALEKQALLPRRKARAEVEAYNRKQMGIKKKAAMALALEKQALLARRKARAEVEAYNRKQMGIKKKDPFRMPDECGYLLYNRQEVDSKMTRLSPGMLRP